VSKSNIIAAAVAAVAAAGMAGSAAARDQIQIVGSSTVFPYTQAVAEQFGSTTEFPSPVVESTGSGGGMKIFCQGIGESYPDITGASRAMKPSEWKLCNENGVTDITEVLVGFDGISLARSRDADAELELTETQIYLALAKEVPVDGEMTANPYTFWSEIDDSLPETEILIYGPPPTSGTRDAFVELAMVDGCMELEAIEAKGEDWAEDNCGIMRTDGHFVEAGENDNLIVQRLEADPTAMGIFGYSFLFENEDKLRGVPVNGTAPNMETIGDGSYDIARPLFFYIKNAHRGVIPGLEEFVAEYVSDDAMGPGGYLAERGLVVLGEERFEQVQDAALNAKSMSAPGS
jgi:phosphate transport system substrate-binding protein